jgi:predicted RNA methylase
MLSIAAALVGTDHVMGVDCDASALAVAISNAEIAEMEENIDFLQARVKDLTAAEASVTSNAVGLRRGGGRGTGRGRGQARGRGQKPAPARCSTTEARQLIMSDDDGLPLASNCVDTVLTNPPFGTKSNAGMDLRFLRTATRLSRRAVYSFHKTSTRNFLKRQVEGWGFEIQVVAEMHFDLPQSYKFHQKKSVDVAVDLIRVIVESV